MVNFGPLAAEIVSLVWGTPGNFNGFRVFAALLHGTLEVGVSQTAALNRGRHLYSAGRPSRWALAHTLVIYLMQITYLLDKIQLSRSHYLEAVNFASDENIGLSRSSACITVVRMETLQHI